MKTAETYNVCFSEYCLFSLLSPVSSCIYFFLYPFYTLKENFILFFPLPSTVEWTIYTHHFRTKNRTTLPGATEETFQFFLPFLLNATLSVQR